MIHDQLWTIEEHIARLKKCIAETTSLLNRAVYENSLRFAESRSEQKTNESAIDISVIKQDQSFRRI